MPTDLDDNGDKTDPNSRVLLRNFLAKAAIELAKCSGSLLTIENAINDIPAHRIKSVLLNLSAAIGETADLLDDCRRYLNEQAVILGAP